MKPGKRKISRALISVFDKTGLLDFVKKLDYLGVEIISTGGTAKVIGEAGYPVTEVSEITGFGEMMDGRVKTLHPKIHGGLLGLRDNQDHLGSMLENNIPEIDLLVVNFYPFQEIVKEGASYDQCIENIDIGGPAMIRSAAKNHNYVTVIVNPNDYDNLLNHLSENDFTTDQDFRKKLAARAFTAISAYDLAISNWMSDFSNDDMPSSFGFIGNLHIPLRYGENPHQKAGFYKDSEANLMLQIQGKELSYNNINDVDAAFDLVSEFDNGTFACAIVKHANPCGVALGESQDEAYRKAFNCDQASAFGGIIALNTCIEKETAELILNTFTEVLIAPDCTEESKKLLQKNKALRVLITGDLSKQNNFSLTWKKVHGGALLQEEDNNAISLNDIKVVTRKVPKDTELVDLMFAWKVAKHVKSNAIVLVKDQSTIGIGAGQMSRVDSSRVAVRKLNEMINSLNLEKEFYKDFVIASDAFFPFADGISEVIEAGAAAIIQPGGSIRDNEVIQAADDAGISMGFTNIRHFKH